MAATSSAKKGARSKTNPNGKTIKVTLVHSTIETPENHRATVRGLGLRRLHQTVEVEDTPSIRGMIRTVAYLLKCEG